MRVAERCTFRSSQTTLAWRLRRSVREMRSLACRAGCVWREKPRYVRPSAVCAVRAHGCPSIRWWLLFASFSGRRVLGAHGLRFCPSVGRCTVEGTIWVILTECVLPTIALVRCHASRLVVGWSDFCLSVWRCTVQRPKWVILTEKFHPTIALVRCARGPD